MPNLCEMNKKNWRNSPLNKSAVKRAPWFFCISHHWQLKVNNKPLCFSGSIDILTSVPIIHLKHQCGGPGNHTRSCGTRYLGDDKRLIVLQAALNREAPRRSSLQPGLHQQPAASSFLSARRLPEPRPSAALHARPGSAHSRAPPTPQPGSGTRRTPEEEKEAGEGGVTGLKNAFSPLWPHVRLSFKKESKLGEREKRRTGGVRAPSCVSCKVHSWRPERAADPRAHAHTHTLRETTQRVPGGTPERELESLHKTRKWQNFSAQVASGVCSTHRYNAALPPSAVSLALCLPSENQFSITMGFTATHWAKRKEGQGGRQRGEAEGERGGVRQRGWQGTKKRKKEREERRN